ncbi:MAG: hypothetical protein Q8M94_00185, partial [Ignavibacteria bacterium]|nr:hypothetical protein [Ignavibacteria bacterium]
MKKNPFKDKKILLSIYPQRYDGCSYKWSSFLEREFGIISSREASEGSPDLGICFGDFYDTYKTFLQKDIPYILAEHDIYSLRLGLNETTYHHDRIKIENAVAIIFTSEDHALYYEKLKKEQGWHIPEYVVIHNKPLKKDMEFTPKKKLEGLNLVYAGGLTAPVRNGILGGHYHYRAYHYIFSQFIKAGWSIHIYPNKIIPINYLRGYKDMGCILHNWIPGDKIYEEMSQYTAGLHSYNRIDTPELAFQYTQLCRPNRLYDNLAAGIPTIGYQGGNGMEVYRDKWGIVIDDLEPETLKAIPERLKKIKITKKMKNDNVLDNEKSKFEYIINVALKEAENKNRRKYYITENPTAKNPFEREYPITVTVENI